MNTHGQSTRRDFLRNASAATLGALAAGYPEETRAREAKVDAGAATADTVIVLFMGGGMAHTETFDPKRHTPFHKGLLPRQVLSTFPAIDTAVDDIKFTAGLEKIASVMDRGTLIRSYTAGDLGHILHTRHQYQWHTGYAPPQNRRGAPYRLGHRPGSGPAQSRRARFHQHWPALRRGRRRGA